MPLSKGLIGGNHLFDASPVFDHSIGFFDRYFFKPVRRMAHERLYFTGRCFNVVIKNHVDIQGFSIGFLGCIDLGDLVNGGLVMFPSGDQFPCFKMSDGWVCSF